MEQTFNIKEFVLVKKECQRFFSHHYTITALLDAIEEMLKALAKCYGQPQNLRLEPTTSYGFRVQATAALLEMKTTMLMDLATMVDIETIQKSDQDELTLENCKTKVALAKSRAVVMFYWCDYWNINQGTLELNLHNLYHR